MGDTQTPYQGQGEWTTGLCGCTHNCCNCLMVTCCSCVTFGQIAARVGHNGFGETDNCVSSGAIYFLVSVIGFGCIPTCLLRQEVAKRTGVKPGSDFIASCCCGPCVMCQMANHVGIQKDGCSFDAPPKMDDMQRV